jgi:FixJ family two-component response regulator
MNAAVLFVDDDEKVLQGYERMLRRHPFDVECMLGARQALAALDAQAEYDIIVSDLRMPGMDGIELLAEVSRRAPDVFRILLTGAADLHVAVQSINRAGVFRLLLKPCPEQELISGLQDALRLRTAVRAEKELLEQTVTGSVSLCMELLASSEPYALRHGERLLSHARRVTAHAKLPLPWRLQLAAMLAPIGFVALPMDLKRAVESGAPLNEEQQAQLKNVPLTTHRLLSHIPRLEPVANIVLRSCSPSHECDSDLWQEADLLAVLTALVALESPTVPCSRALDALKGQSGLSSEAIETVRQSLGVNPTQLTYRGANSNHL